ncbi:MAG TPA: trypsin-like peptidase domain-containing protein [Gemmatimonadales bacterium]|nr:trypsin-like peptidase domain-containing protein [Gemmatimonadales bacterium]
MERIILRHLKGSKAGSAEEFPLADLSELTLGRDPIAQVRFDADKDDLVGRQHARILRDASDPVRFSLTDLNSRNGTFLNKVRIVGSVPLAPGDIIQLGAGGPEVQFEIDPVPAAYVKATRLGGIAAPAAGGPAETRVGGAVVTPAAERPAASVGKATVERLIGQTRDEGKRTTMVAVAAVVLLAVAGGAYLKSNSDSSADGVRQQAELLAARADSIGKAGERAQALGTMMTPAEVAEKNSGAVVQVDFSWNLIYAPSGAQVYHRYVPNQMEVKVNGKKQTITLMPGGGGMVPAYVQLDNGMVEPALTLDPNSGAPIAVTGSGSGFVVTNDGFILTNRHVAANWRAPYGFDQNAVGVVLQGGQIAFDQSGEPILTRPPSRWIPSETKQAGPKDEFDVFRGRQEYMMVRFRKNTTPLEAQTQRVSDQHDVALIKVSAPSTLPKTDLYDSYTETKVGDQVIVMGYPAVSDYVVAVLRSRDLFNRDAQQRVVPDPTVSVGNIGKILRAADGPTSQSMMEYSSGDTYQLTINSTGGGNSGGPMFDAFGNVIGIFFAGKTTDAQISFAIPIRYGMELLKIGDPTAR